LGVITALGLHIVGLQNGLIVGFLAGLFSFLPYVGTLIGFGVAMIVGYWQFDGIIALWPIALVFVLQQGLEGYILGPKLIGDKVGLHPVWMIFALMAGGSLLGFVGVLLAVPIAAVIAVLLRTMLHAMHRPPHA
ncbi:MAG: AI-2E family transporter, partial [Pseudomonadota bacterium]